MSDEYSIHTGVIRSLGVVDYILFALMFVVSSGIGFYHAFKDRNKTNVEDFHLSGRKMHPIPVSLSLAATFLSAITLLGNPSEVYTYGTMFYWICFAMLIATISSAHFFLPIFYNLNKTSTFEYIELRFGKINRTFTSAVFLFQTLIYMGFVLYAPSIAFQAVTGLSLWGTIIAVASVCTLYTTLGGMKTVLWTDTLQLSIMVAGLIAVLAQSSNIAGGFAKAWEIAAENGRIDLTNFSTDLRTRHSVWSVGIGGALMWTYLYGVNQAQVQRSCSLPSLKRAQLAIWMNFPALVLIITLTCMIGVTMYAFYKDCDPVKYGLVDKPDQMLPLMVLDILGNIPGLTGLFVACVFSGSLSSISSGLNAMSAVLLEDFLKPFCCKSLTGKKAILLSKLLVLVLGVFQFGVAYLISKSGGLLLQLVYSLFSIMSGPLMGIFVAGMVFPWTNRYGAFSGLLVSLAAMSWLVIGAAVEKPSGVKVPLPVSTVGCNWDIKNISALTHTPTTQTTLLVSTTEFKDTGSGEESILMDFYRLSYQWFTGFGLLVNLTVSLLVSFITGHTDPKTVDHHLMIPLFYKLCPWLPERYRKYLLFGVNYEDDSNCEKEKVMEIVGFDNTAFDQEIHAKDVNGINGQI